MATLCEDYVYEQIQANLEQYPSFKAKINVPKELNFKTIYDDKDLKETTDSTSVQGFSEFANPLVHEGSNSKPGKPNQAFIINFLKKRGIGTGATRYQTLTEISSGKNALMEQHKGKFILTYNGQVQAILSEGTSIASPAVTKKLFDGMKAVKELKMDYRQLPQAMKNIVTNDLPIMQKNATNLLSDKRLKNLKAPKAPKKKEKISGTFNGQQIKFTSEWNGHNFDDEEIHKLLNGEEISFEATSKKGTKYVVHGKLERQTFKGHKFWGFKRSVDK